MMTPLPGDTLIDRYELVKPLHQAPGLAAWQATDHVLDRDCQLFIVTDPHASVAASTLASALVLSKDQRFTPVLHMHTVDDVVVLVTALDDGISLSEYLQGPAAETLSFDAMRVIVGECALALQTLIRQGLADRAISTDVIRLSNTHIRIADAPVSAALVTPLLHGGSGYDDYDDTPEPLAVRQLAGVLYDMLTRTPYCDDQTFDAQRLIDVKDKSHDFWIICQRGLGFPNPDGSKPTPISTLDELIALIGYWKPVDQLTDEDLIAPSLPGAASIINAKIRPVDPTELLELPERAIHRRSDPSKASKSRQPDWSPNLLLFPEPNEVEMLRPTQRTGDDLLAPLHDEFVVPKGTSNPTIPVNVSAMRHTNAGAPTLPHFSGSPDATQSAPIAIPRAPESAPAGAGEPYGYDNPAEQHVGQNAGTAPTPDATPGHRTELSGLAGVGEAPSLASQTMSGDAGEEASPSLERLVNSVEARQEAAAEANHVFHVDSVPPSFTPGQSANGTGDEDEDEDAEEHGNAANGMPNSIESANDVIFGRFTTRSVVIVIGTILLVAALVLATLNLFNRPDTGFVEPKNGAWPEISNVPFPGRVTPTASDDASASASASESSSASASTSGAVTDAVDHSDRNVESVPTPTAKPTPTNTTAYPITQRGFLSRPNGLNGYGWYIKLDAPHDVYKVEIQLRQNNGHGSVYVNSNRNNPQNGASMGDWTVDASGHAVVTFAQPVNTQEIVIWVPADGLPTGGRITFSSVNAY